MQSASSSSFNPGEVEGALSTIASSEIRIGVKKRTPPTGDTGRGGAAGAAFGVLYFIDERFRDNANTDPSTKPVVAKWRMKQRVRASRIVRGVDPNDTFLSR